jgi:YVTN family beta-propeller protein
LAADPILVTALTPAVTAAFESGPGLVVMAGRRLETPIVVRLAGTPSGLVPGTPVQLRVSAGSFGFGDGVLWTAADADGAVRGFFTAPPTPGPVQLVADLGGGRQITTTLTVSIEGALTPLQILATAPAANTFTGIHTLVAADFSNPVDVATITPASFAVRLQPDGTPVAGSFGFTNGGKRVVFTPAAPLQSSQAYRLEIGVGGPIRDVFQMPLLASRVVPFSTLPPAALFLAAIDPPAARAGDPIVLSGAGFGTTPQQNEVVFGGGVRAVPLGGDSGALVVLVPFGATSGPVLVHVRATDSNAQPFGVIVPAAPSDSIIANVTVPVSGQQIAITPDGSRAYMTAPGAGVVVPIHIADQRPEPAIGVGAYPFGLALAPDGAHLYVSNFFSNDVSVIDTKPSSPTFHQVVARIPVGVNPAGIAVNPNGRKLYVVNYGDGTFTIIDTDPTSASFESAIANGSTGGTGGQSVAVRPDGSRVIIGTATGILIVDANSGAAIANGSSGGTGGQSVAVTPDGGFAVVLTTDGRIVLFDIRPGSPTENLAIANGSSGGTGGQSVAVRPDGAFVYVTHTDGHVEVLSLVQLSGGGALPGKAALPGASAGAMQGARRGGPRTATGTFVFEPVSSITVGENPSGLAFEPNATGLLLVVNSGSNSVTFIDTGSLLPISASARLVFDPSTLSLGAIVSTIKAYVELDPPLDPASIIANTVTLNGLVKPDRDLGIQDHDGDLIPERVLEFDRHKFESALVQGQNVPVQMTGRLANGTFLANGVFQVIRPQLVAPAPNAVLAAGSNVAIRWLPMQSGPAHHVSLYASYGEAAPMETLASSTADDSLFLWAVPQHAASQCIVYVVARDAAGTVLGVGATNGTFRIDAATAAETTLPVRYALAALPNPFRGGTTFQFDLPEPQAVVFRVYAVDGTLVRTIADGRRFQAGRHMLGWDGRDAAGRDAGNGVYFVRVQAGTWVTTQKVVRLR